MKNFIIYYTDKNTVGVRLHFGDVKEGDTIRSPKDYSKQHVYAIVKESEYNFTCMAYLLNDFKEMNKVRNGIVSKSPFKEDWLTWNFRIISSSQFFNQLDDLYEFETKVHKRYQSPYSVDDMLDRCDKYLDKIDVYQNNYIN